MGGNILEYNILFRIKKFSRISWYHFWSFDGSFALMFVSPANIIVPVNVDAIIDSIVSILSNHSIFSSICGLGCYTIPSKIDEFLFFSITVQLFYLVYLNLHIFLSQVLLLDMLLLHHYVSVLDFCKQNYSLVF